MAKREEIIVGLDIGTTKVACLVGEITEDGIDIIGVGTQPCAGLKKGVVVNIDSTVAAVAKAVEEAEHMAGVEITQVYAGIAGSHIKAFHSEGVVAIRDREVRPGDIERVIEAAKAVSIPQDREILHVVPREFSIDQQDGIKEPLGMAGVRLEAKVHIVTAASASAQNIIKCCTRCGLEVQDLVLEPYATAESVLHSDEKELGVALLDIGGGTSDLVVFSEGALVHTIVLPIGGHQLTNDIAVGLRTPMSEAERLKHKHGCALSSLIAEDETIEVPSVGGRPPRVMPRTVLSDILQPRVDEIFSLVRDELERCGLSDMLASGMVVTGGSTLLQGLPELAEEILGMPVRRGVPQGIGGLSDVVKTPIYATAVGLVLYGARKQDGLQLSQSSERRGVWRRMRSWFAEVF
ncbi:MAG TPA: cell division protein FtsA [Pseudomonadota bacterium]|jgi:cell division protein FtsA|nr:cell division protein FtsA [Pseudomonadota bacterium]HND12084.1 cell division protein FtsA [Pseudomonadota bacterium]HNI60898.1 cell division protein FtsA [Pseudomonadota bacterium]HNK43817.1 cell division protein FtsA [Pseudomonadota bacterium]HNN49530.1 cell division protein FtsA [Pseudomonadota bacterium]